MASFWNLFTDENDTTDRREAMKFIRSQSCTTGWCDRAITPRSSGHKTDEGFCGGLLASFREEKSVRRALTSPEHSRRRHSAPPSPGNCSNKSNATQDTQSTRASDASSVCSADENSNGRIRVKFITSPSFRRGGGIVSFPSRKKTGNADVERGTEEMKVVNHNGEMTLGKTFAHKQWNFKLLHNDFIQCLLKENEMEDEVEENTKGESETDTVEAAKQASAPDVALDQLPLVLASSTTPDENDIKSTTVELTRTNTGISSTHSAIVKRKNRRLRVRRHLLSRSRIKELKASKGTTSGELGRKNYELTSTEKSVRKGNEETILPVETVRHLADDKNTGETCHPPPPPPPPPPRVDRMRPTVSWLPFLAENENVSMNDPSSFLSSKVQLFKDRSTASTQGASGGYEFDCESYDSSSISMVQGKEAALAKIRQKTQLLNYGNGDGDAVRTRSMSFDYKNSKLLSKTSSFPSTTVSTSMVTPAINHDVKNIKVINAPKGRQAVGDVVETRSLLKIKVGFLYNIVYGILLRWVVPNPSGRPEIFVIVLNKMAGDGFLKLPAASRSKEGETKSDPTGICMASQTLDLISQTTGFLPGVDSLINLTLGPCNGLYCYGYDQVGSGNKTASISERIKAIQQSPKADNGENGQKMLTDASCIPAKPHHASSGPKSKKKSKQSLHSVQFHQDGSCTVITSRVTCPDSLSKKATDTEVTLLVPPYCVSRPNDAFLEENPPSLHIQLSHAIFYHRSTSGSPMARKKHSSKPVLLYAKLSMGSVQHVSRVVRSTSIRNGVLPQSEDETGEVNRTLQASWTKNDKNYANFDIMTPSDDQAVQIEVFDAKKKMQLHVLLGRITIPIDDMGPISLKESPRRMTITVPRAKSIVCGNKSFGDIDLTFDVRYTDPTRLWVKEEMKARKKRASNAEKGWRVW